MARYGRRSTHRRAGRRGARTLSARRIFGNKSARSQANQINALKKRVSYVYRQCRPETKLVEDTPGQFYIAYDDTAPYRLISLDMPMEGVGDNAMTGNSINVQDVHLYMNAVVQAMADDNTAPTYLLQGGVPITMDYRVILFATKAANDYAPDIADILDIEDRATSLNSYSMNAVKPLVPGVSSVVKIFYDRKFSLSAQGRVSRSHHLTLKGKQIYKYIRSNATYSKGRLFALIVPVLHFENNLLYGTTPFKPAGLFNTMIKIAYTDP